MTPTAPVAPVKAPTHIPSFITELIIRYATDAAPAIAAASAKYIDSLLDRSGQQQFTGAETTNVTGVIVMVITRSAGLLRNV